MKRLVTVSICSEQTDAEGTCDRVEYTAPGEYTTKDGKHYLTYREMDEALSGQVTLKMEESGVTMMRHGKLSARLQFLPNERCAGVYHTPYGALNLVTFTHPLRCRFEESGEMRTKYTLFMEENPVMHTTLRVCWEERK